MSTYQKHLADIRSGTITQHNVIDIRKAINLRTRFTAGWSISRNAKVWSVEEMYFLLCELSARKPHAAGEIHTTVLKLLRDTRYAKTFDADQRSIIESDGCYFKLTGFDAIGRRGENCVATYECCALDGRSFFFRHIPWQSGGKGPEVLS